MNLTAESTAVAIVGVAFEFPGCDGWSGLTTLLREGRDVMRQVPAERVAATGIRRSSIDRDGGWIDDITRFDYRYFGLSRAEAELVDPRQRRMLHLARQAIGDAGYAPGELAGGNVAVLVAGYGGPRVSLFDLLPPASQRDSAAATGSLYAYAAGRIAYHLDLRGAAEVIDTSCASFLVALHEARWKVVRGECDLALVGGYELTLGDASQRSNVDSLGLLSATGRCRPFDAAGDGVTWGEGGGFVLVKRLSAAVRDGDCVHAVIRGSAVNQDARRTTGLTAPSPDAQSEVIMAAWRDAGLAPEAVGYIEAHGTGTQIGDPIEIQGLAGAFAALPSPPAAVWLSSAKGNLGHLAAMASFAGLVRVLAQFRAGEIFPTAGFQRPNPLLALGRVPVRIADRVAPWSAGEHRRHAAISSFGLSGTNAHLVVEEGLQTVPSAHDYVTEQVVVLSACDAAGLTRQVRELHGLVAQAPDRFDLVAASQVLASGREHFRLRLGWVVSHAKELLDSLETAAAPEDAAPSLPVAIALGDVRDVPLIRLRQFAGSYRGFARAVAEAEESLPGAGWSPAQRALVWLVGGHNVLTDAGVEADLLVTHGLGGVAARIIRGETNLRSALDAVAEAAGAATPPDAARLTAALATPHMIVDLAPGSMLSEALGEAATPLAEALRRLYLQGRDLDWLAVIGRPRRRVELPVAPLSEQHCWPVVAPPASDHGTTAEDSTNADDGATADGGAASRGPRDGSVVDLVLQLACDVLREPELTLADDFLNLGGNSLNGSQLMTRINERLGTDLDVLDLMEQPDLGALARTVAEAVADNSPETSSEPPARTAGEAALSSQQLAILADNRLAEPCGIYNVPIALGLDGAVDPATVTGWLTVLVRRHSQLRARLQDTPTGPRQVITPAEDMRVELASLELDITGSTAREGRQQLLDRLEDLTAVPLSPYDDPPARYQLIQVYFADGVRQVLLIILHRMFADAWSGHLIFLALGSGDGVAPQRDYRDYVRDQQRLLAERSVSLQAFWTGYLAGSRYVPLPTDRPASGDAAAGLWFALDAECAYRLGDLAQRDRGTLHMVLLAGWVALLWRLTGDRDVTVAVTSSGRAPVDGRVIGNCAGTVVVRVVVRPDESFAGLLAAVREATLLTFVHQDLPAEQIMQIAQRGSDPLCSTMFTTGGRFGGQFDAVRRLGDGGSSIELLGIEQSAPVLPLSMVAPGYGQEEFRMHLQFDHDLFRRETVEEWLCDYHQLLLRLAENDTAVLPTIRELLSHAVPNRP